jgi:hypothetical protein
VTLRFQDKKVLVTGAGDATAEAFLDGGAMALS